MDKEKIVLEIGDLLAKLRTETKIDEKIGKQLDKVDEEINILYKMVENKDVLKKNYVGNDYYHDIQKVEENRYGAIYSYRVNHDKRVRFAVIGSGAGQRLIDALGNALVKESFQKFEK